VICNTVELMMNAIMALLAFLFPNQCVEFLLLYNAEIKLYVFVKWVFLKFSMFLSFI